MMGMNGVLGKPALARQDAAIGVGRTQRLGARWRQSVNTDGSNPTPVDLSAATCELIIVSNSGETWLRKIVPGSINGVIAAEVSAAETSGPEWAARTTGQWSLVVTRESGVTVVAEGNMRIIQGTL